MDDTRLSVDALLRARARRVIPGGMWGHLNAANRLHVRLGSDDPRL
jgi:hypothetical protein